MRKLIVSILSILCGLCVGIGLIIGVFSILNLKSSNENVLAQSFGKEQSDTMTQVETGNLKSEETSAKAETEFLQEESETTEEIELTNHNSYYIRVNREANCVTVYIQDNEGNYTVPVKAMTCSVGVNNQTPLGVGAISDKYEWRLLFGNVYGHYSVRFNGHILFHSVPYRSKANHTLVDSQYNRLGEAASMGCVRLCVADAKWIYDNCAKGTTVEVYDDPNPGPLGKPELPVISESSLIKGWDPTDPHPENPWHSDITEN